MAYTKNTWQTGDTITADLMNHMEDGIYANAEAASSQSGAIENVQTALETKESVANKVTEITDESTDEQYPSAKAVYDAIEEAGQSGGTEREIVRFRVTLSGENATGTLVRGNVEKLKAAIDEMTDSSTQDEQLDLNRYFEFQIDFQKGALGAEFSRDGFIWSAKNSTDYGKRLYIKAFIPHILTVSPNVLYTIYEVGVQFNYDETMVFTVTPLSFTAS